MTTTDGLILEYPTWAIPAEAFQLKSLGRWFCGLRHAITRRPCPHRKETSR